VLCPSCLELSAPSKELKLSSAPFHWAGVGTPATATPSSLAITHVYCHRAIPWLYNISSLMEVCQPSSQPRPRHWQSLMSIATGLFHGYIISRVSWKFANPHPSHALITGNHACLLPKGYSMAISWLLHGNSLILGTITSWAFCQHLSTRFIHTWCVDSPHSP